MDSKLAFLNLAADYYRSDDSKIFLNKDNPEPCKSCSKSYYFIDKKYNFCNKCFLNTHCTVDFHDNNVIIKMNDSNEVIFEEKISILSSPNEDDFERSRVSNLVTIKITNTTNV